MFARPTRDQTMRSLENSTRRGIARARGAWRYFDVTVMPASEELEAYTEKSVYRGKALRRWWKSARRPRNARLTEPCLSEDRNLDSMISAMRLKERSRPYHLVKRRTFLEQS